MTAALDAWVRALDYSKSAVGKTLPGMMDELAIAYGERSALVEDGAAIGVELASGEKLAADIVVSNADSAWTYRNLVPAENRKRWTDSKLDRASYSMGLFVWYFGVDRRYEDIGHHTILMGPRYRELLKDIFRHKILAEDLEAIFYEKLKAFFVTPERIAAHLATARQGLDAKEARLVGQQKEIQRVREEMTRTHRLYLDGQIPLESFGGYHKPLEEQLLQLQNELPKLEAEVTHLKIRDLSADAVLREARELYANWPTLPVERKQSVVQSLVEKIVVGPDEIEIRLSYLPSSEELTKSQQHLSHTFPCMSYKPHAFGCFVPTGCVVFPLLALCHPIASKSPA